MRKTLIVLAALAVSSTLPAFAQKPDVTGGTVVASEPGKAAAVRAVKITAQVVAIDKTSRTVTLKGPKGNVVDIVAGDDVKKFDQIKIGAFVLVNFLQSLSLTLQNTKTGGGIPEQSTAVTAKPG